MGNRAVLRENMNKITRALCILMSVVTLSGCASQGTQGVSIADFAEHSVSTAAVPEVTSEPVQQESAPQSDVSSAEITAELSDPDSSAAENQPDTAGNAGGNHTADLQHTGKAADDRFRCAGSYEIQYVSSKGTHHTAQHCNDHAENDSYDHTGCR